MAKISPSLQEAIQEEPKRFIRGLDFRKINSSNNPQLEFLRQIEKRFDKPTGIFLWRFLLNNYKTTNKFYKMNIIGKKVKKVPNNLNRVLVERFYEDYRIRKEREQERRDILSKKTLLVKRHTRKGKIIESYFKNKGYKYNEIQKRFIKSRMNLSTKLLADEFNNAFGTKITSIGIRDKKLRIMGRKKG